MKLLIHSQISIATLLKFGNGNFIPHFSGHMITYSWWDWSNPSQLNGCPHFFSFDGKAYIVGWLGVCVVVCRVVKVFSKFLQCRVNNFEIWHTCYPHRCPTTCGIIILIIVFMDFFFMQNRTKFEFLEVWGHFLKKISMWDHETWSTGTLWVLSRVCEKWPHWAIFLGPFGSWIAPKWLSM